jgi:glycosyltransferase involved in cell wall biosynthesis
LEPESTDSIRATIEKILKNNDLLKNISSESRPLMEKFFTVRRYADDIELIIKKLQ